MHHAFSRSLLLLPLPLAGCGGDSNGSPPAAIVSGTIGAEGGSLSVTSGALAGASITIPAGALTAPVAISFFEDTASLVPGFVDVGPAVRIEPDGLPLALPGVLTLPFDPTRVPPAVTAADFIVRMRLGDGRVFEEPARHVDQALGLVTVDALQVEDHGLGVLELVGHVLGLVERRRRHDVRLGRPQVPPVDDAANDVFADPERVADLRPAEFLRQQCRHPLDEAGRVVGRAVLGARLAHQALAIGAAILAAADGIAAAAPPPAERRRHAAPAPHAPCRSLR